MKRLMLVLMLVLLSTVTYAQFQFVEVESNLRGFGNLKVVRVEEDRSYFFQYFTDDSWQMHVSKIFRPADGISISLGAGVEKQGYRLASSLRANQGDFALAMIREMGSSGHWYKDTLMYKPSDLSVGIISQRFMGVGLTSSVQVSNSTSVCFSAFDDGAKQVSIRRTF